MTNMKTFILAALAAASLTTAASAEMPRDSAVTVMAINAVYLTICNAKPPQELTRAAHVAYALNIPSAEISAYSAEIVKTVREIGVARWCNATNTVIKAISEQAQ